MPGVELLRRSTGLHNVPARRVTASEALIENRCRKCSNARPDVGVRLLGSALQLQGTAQQPKSTLECHLQTRFITVDGGPATEHLCVPKMLDALQRPPMWTPAVRAQLARDAIPYATSLTDKEWAVLFKHLVRPSMG